MGYSNYYKILPASGLYEYEGTLTMDIPLLCDTTSISWSYYSSISGRKIAYWASGNNLVDVGAKTTNAGEILKCTTSNRCGTSYGLYTFFTGDMIPPPPPLVLNPNPAGTQTEVSIPDQSIRATEIITTETYTATPIYSSGTPSTIYTLSVLNSSGLIVYTAKSSDKKIKVPTSSLINGLYVVVVTDGSKIYQGNLLVSH